MIMSPLLMQALMVRSWRKMNTVKDVLAYFGKVQTQGSGGKVGIGWGAYAKC
jgi:hypothetical protein